jgi:hypothetical protein
MSNCANCPRPAGSRFAENQIGFEVQALTNDGWLPLPDHQYPTCCEAQRAFDTLPKTPLELRTYPTLVIKSKKER